VVDRISILEIKHNRIQDRTACAHIQRELDTLRDAWAQSHYPPIQSLPQWSSLLQTNTALWEVEDALREHESRACFDDHFVQLARSVYQLNDKRAAIKGEINKTLDSRLVEIKSYHGHLDP
jgi:hypothetical protein